jgi:hypothetical protein
MTSEQAAIANSISNKYQLLHDTFNDLACDAARFHNALLVHDMAARGLYNALSRIVAFSDQLQVGLSLMREDVRAIETALSDPADACWAAHLDGFLEEWCAKRETPISKLN